MKLTLEIYGTNYTVDSPKDDAADAETLMNHFKGLLVAAGFHPETVDSMLPGESPWYSPGPEACKITTEDLENVC